MNTQPIAETMDSAIIRLKLLTAPKQLVTYHGKQNTKLGLQRGAVYQAKIIEGVAYLDVKPHVCYYRTKEYTVLNSVNN